MLRSTDTGILETPTHSPERSGSRRMQPLGAMLVFKRNKRWCDAASAERRPFDLDDPVVLKRLEKRLSSCIYRIYGYHEAPEAGWEFFSLLEFEDLEAWQQLQTHLDLSGFSTYYTWNIVTLGRRLG